jgi:glycosyltransferase involved in cell wall biosynthesis
MIAGAEAQRIGRSLASVSEWAGEIIVVLNEEVDDGTDKIALQYGAKVFRHAWQGFREQKNLSFGYAQLPWLLSIDADEVVSPELRESIIQFIESDPKGFAGAKFARRVWYMGRWITHGDWYPDHVLRLIRRQQGKWGGSPEHCAVLLNGTSRRITGDLLHYTNPTISNYVQKINYYADLYLQNQLARGTKWSAPAVVIRSAWRFIRAYIFRRGFLDGYPGFFIAASTAYATLVRHSRLYEHLQQQKEAKSREVAK